MKVHDRTFVVSLARGEVEDSIMKIQTTYDLTFGEIVSILGVVLATKAKYEIRQERHGCSSIPGDQADN